MGTDTHPAESQAGQAFEVIHHDDNRFYELLADGQPRGLAVYEAAGNRYIFTHTFITEGHRGQGCPRSSCGACWRTSRRGTSR